MSSKSKSKSSHRRVPLPSSASSSDGALAGSATSSMAAHQSSKSAGSHTAALEQLHSIAQRAKIDIRGTKANSSPFLNALMKKQQQKHEHDDGDDDDEKSGTSKSSSSKHSGDAKYANGKNGGREEDETDLKLREMQKQQFTASKIVQKATEGLKGNLSQLTAKVDLITRSTSAMSSGLQQVALDDTPDGVQNTGIPSGWFSDATGAVLHDVAHLTAQKTSHVQFTRVSNAAKENGSNGVNNLHDWLSVVTLPDGNIIAGGTARLSGSNIAMVTIQGVMEDGETGNKDFRGNGKPAIDLFPAPSDLCKMILSPDEKTLYVLATVGNPSVKYNPITVLMALDANTGETVQSFGGHCLRKPEMKFNDGAPMKGAGYGMGPGKIIVNLGEKVIPQTMTVHPLTGIIYIAVLTSDQESTTAPTCQIVSVDPTLGLINPEFGVDGVLELEALGSASVLSNSKTKKVLASNNVAVKQLALTVRDRPVEWFRVANELSIIQTGSKKGSSTFSLFVGGQDIGFNTGKAAHYFLSKLSLSGETDPLFESRFHQDFSSFWKSTYGGYQPSVPLSECWSRVQRVCLDAYTSSLIVLLNIASIPSQSITLGFVGFARIDFNGSVVRSDDDKMEIAVDAANDDYVSTFLRDLVVVQGSSQSETQLIGVGHALKHSDNLDTTNAIVCRLSSSFTITGVEIDAVPYTSEYYNTFSAVSSRLDQPSVIVGTIQQRKIKSSRSGVIALT